MFKYVVKQEEYANKETKNSETEFPEYTVTAVVYIPPVAASDFKMLVVSNFYKKKISENQTLREC